MKIVYFGTPDFACIPLEKLNTKHEVCMVVSMPDKPQGRKMQLTPTKVKEKAIELGLLCITPEKLKGNEDVLEKLRAFEPDFFIVFAYGKIMQKELLSIPKYGCLNIHVSDLPKYRGAAPIQHAIMSGDEKTGITIMKMGEGLDTGDILLKEETFIGTKNARDIALEMAEKGADLLLENLEKIARGEIIGKAQPSESPTPYAFQITKEMGEIDWKSSAFMIARKVQAFNDAPIAWTKLGNVVLKIYEGENIEGSGSPGVILAADKQGIKVGCGDGIYVIKKLQSPGKKVLCARDFLIGNKLEIGTILG